jgi:hypothetical protein
LPYYIFERKAHFCKAQRRLIKWVTNGLHLRKENKTSNNLITLSLCDKKKSKKGKAKGLKKRDQNEEKKELTGLL